MFMFHPPPPLNVPIVVVVVVLNAPRRAEGLFFSRAKGTIVGECHHDAAVVVLQATIRIGDTTDRTTITMISFQSQHELARGFCLVWVLEVCFFIMERFHTFYRTDLCGASKLRQHESTVRTRTSVRYGSINQLVVVLEQKLQP